MPKSTTSRGASRIGTLVPDLVVARRIALGLLQKEVAARAGISAQYMADIEAGRRYGAPPVRVAIAKALRTPLYELTGGEE
jgi:transcriptional regulator with XRE-family HTH domain